jgi:hypothetical protein
MRGWGGAFRSMEHKQKGRAQSLTYAFPSVVSVNEAIANDRMYRTNQMIAAY